MNTYLQGSFSKINQMKKFLKLVKRTGFTRKEFLNETDTTAHVFNQMVSNGLVINTGEIYTDRIGAPHVFKLQEAFFNESNLTSKYKLTSEDIDLLINAKNIKLNSLNNSIKVMRNEAAILTEQQQTLKKLK